MKKVLLFPMLCLIVNSLCAQSRYFSISNLSVLNKSHDIEAGCWGPYSKQYAGISHIGDLHSGLRFDFSVFPGYYRNKIIVPNVLFESGYFPWKVSEDLKNYTYRYELEWKDHVFVDVTYRIIDSARVLVKMHCVNNTPLPQDLTLNLMANVSYPESYSEKKLMVDKTDRWINGADYTNLYNRKGGPKDNLVTDGLMKGEIRSNEYIGSSAVRLGNSKGDKVTYAVPDNINGNSKMVLVYKLGSNENAVLQLTGLVNQKVTLIGTGDLQQKEVLLPANSGSHLITLELVSGNPVDLNGLLFSDVNKKNAIVREERSYQPEIVSDIIKKNAWLKYRDMDTFYGIAWDSNDFKIREVRNDELDIYFRKLVHNHVDSIFSGNGKGHFFNIFIRPIDLAPSSEKVFYGLICQGNQEEVKGILDTFDEVKKNYEESAVAAGIHSPEILPEGKKFEHSECLLRATLLANIVYPIYTQRSYIRHYTPGKWWNSLYTWDSGFIAIGLNEVNMDRAIECINAYTTEEGSQSAFIHHGSPVPVQMYAFWDLRNRTQSKELLSYFYPRLRQYYRFLSGQAGSSTTANLKSGLIRTWDYFYNSGGWDDYPAQVAVHKQRAETSVTPVISTAQCIRTAKMLRMAACALGLRKDVNKYDHDIRRLSEALQKYSWNQSSGYFSYVVHDPQGRPTGPFSHSSGKDYNMGLDGIYPLFAGICTSAQEKELVEKLFSPSRLWTPSGICVVDQSAPYYREDGYWNGAVWMPHQWFMWKTMLDLGRPDLAFKIARKGLEVYSGEADESYYTFEHFFAKSGRGAGWHQFSGLSTPVLSWFSSYYKVGTVTSGFEIWIQSQRFNADKSEYTATLAFDETTTAHERCLLVCLNPNYQYTATLNGRVLPLKCRFPGMLEILLPSSNKEGRLKVEPVLK